MSSWFLQKYAAEIFYLLLSRDLHRLPGNPGRALGEKGCESPALEAASCPSRSGHPAAAAASPTGPGNRRPGTAAPPGRQRGGNVRLEPLGPLERSPQISKWARKGAQALRTTSPGEALTLLSTISWGGPQSRSKLHSVHLQHATKDGLIYRCFHFFDSSVTRLKPTLTPALPSHHHYHHHYHQVQWPSKMLIISKFYHSLQLSVFCSNSSYRCNVNNTWGL